MNKAPTVQVHVIHEIEGGSLVLGFMNEQDAQCYLNQAEAHGELLPGHYTVSPLDIKDFSNASIKKCV